MALYIPHEPPKDPGNETSREFRKIIAKSFDDEDMDKLREIVYKKENAIVVYDQDADDEVEDVIELHILSSETDADMVILSELCEQHGLDVIRLFWRSVEPDDEGEDYA